ncbi:hypothetical protein Tco_1133313 [Tanacetum coccineum]
MPRTMGTNDDEAGSSQSKRSRHETVEDKLLPQVYHEFLLWEGCTRDAKSRYNTRFAQLLPRHIYSPCIINWDVLHRMGCDGEIDDMLRIRLCEAESEEEIFTLVAWIRSFNINEPIYAKLCHEFYSTYDFDEVCADDELQLKRSSVELEEDGFNVYLKGGLRSDDNFNATDYWTTGYDKVQKNDLWLLRAGTQKESQIYYGQFILKLARKCKVLTEDVVRSLRSPIYCRNLDTTTLQDLIDSNGNLILEDPQPGVPRVVIPRPSRESMQDLYDRMGRIQIRQDVIERM